MADAGPEFDAPRQQVARSAICEVLALLPLLERCCKEVDDDKVDPADFQLQVRGLLRRMNDLGCVVLSAINDPMEETADLEFRVLGVSAGSGKVPG